MATIVIWDAYANTTKVDFLVKCAREASEATVVVASTNSNHADFVIDPNNHNAALQSLANILSGPAVIVDAGADISRDAFFSLLESAATSGVAFLPYANSDRSDAACLFEVSRLVGTLMGGETYPLAAVKLSHFAFSSDTKTAVAGIAEFILSAMIAEIAAGQEVSMLPETISVADTTPYRLDRASIARCLRITLVHCNIEELFPQHAWSDHQKECAAMCYHTLASNFIKLGNTDYAIECLALSDQLDDSPRTLALKGVIARQRGETLEAVANLVASLQQYEIRKKDQGTRYISFSPVSLEDINAKLQMGLEALNKRQNDSALEHFADAIFQFDGFYHETGITKEMLQ